MALIWQRSFHVIFQLRTFTWKCWGSAAMQSTCHAVSYIAVEVKEVCELVKSVSQGVGEKGGLSFPPQAAYAQKLHPIKLQKPGSFVPTRWKKIAWRNQFCLGIIIFELLKKGLALFSFWCVVSLPHRLPSGPIIKLSKDVPQVSHIIYICLYRDRDIWGIWPRCLMPDRDGQLNV